ncbi:hypothetical protein HMPREF9543_01575, partial [Escherichia coli MS 146-1]
QKFDLFNKALRNWKVMVPAQLNGEISMSRTTACLTRIAASEQFFI